MKGSLEPVLFGGLAVFHVLQQSGVWQPIQVAADNECFVGELLTNLGLLKEFPAAGPEGVLNVPNILAGALGRPVGSFLGHLGRIVGAQINVHVVDLRLERHESVLGPVEFVPEEPFLAPSPVVVSALKHHKVIHNAAVLVQTGFQDVQLVRHHDKVHQRTRLGQDMTTKDGRKGWLSSYRKPRRSGESELFRVGRTIEGRSSIRRWILVLVVVVVGSFIVVVVSVPADLHITQCQRKCVQQVKIRLVETTCGNIGPTQMIKDTTKGSFRCYRNRVLLLLWR